MTLNYTLYYMKRQHILRSSWMWTEFLILYTCTCKWYTISILMIAFPWVQCMFTHIHVHIHVAYVFKEVASGSVYQWAWQIHVHVNEHALNYTTLHLQISSINWKVSEELCSIIKLMSKYSWVGMCKVSLLYILTQWN